MGENDNVDSRVIQAQRIQVASEDSGVGTAVNDHSARSVSDVSRVALTDVEQAHDELCSAGVRDETRYRWPDRPTLRRTLARLR